MRAKLYLFEAVVAAFLINCSNAVRTDDLKTPPTSPKPKRRSKSPHAITLDDLLKESLFGYNGGTRKEPIHKNAGPTKKETTTELNDNAQTTVPDEPKALETTANDENNDKLNAVDDELVAQSNLNDEKPKEVEDLQDLNKPNELDNDKEEDNLADVTNAQEISGDSEIGTTEESDETSQVEDEDTSTTDEGSSFITPDEDTYFKGPNYNTRQRLQENLANLSDPVPSSTEDGPAEETPEEKEDDEEQEDASTALENQDNTHPYIRKSPENLKEVGLDTLATVGNLLAGHVAKKLNAPTLSKKKESTHNGFKRSANTIKSKYGGLKLKRETNGNSEHLVSGKTTQQEIQPVKLESDLISSNADLSIALRYLGAGYDIIFGNPLGDPTIMVDPGYRNPVIRLNWDYEYFNDDGANLKEPKGSWVRPELSCRQAESIIKINTVDDYKKELSVDAQISANIPFYFSFSGSAGYKNFVKNSSSKNTHTYILKTYCLRYVAGISDYKNMQTTPEFMAAVENLPKDFDANKCPIEKFSNDENDPACLNEIKPWMQFFKDFGTHFTTIIHLGGKVTNQFTVDKSDITSIKQKGLNIDSVLKANVGIPFSNLGGGVASSSETMTKSAANSLNSEKLVIVIGGDIQADVTDKKSMREWTMSLTHKPMPIKVRLESIRTLIPDPTRQAIFDKALTYYSETYGISHDEMYRVDGKSMGVGTIIMDAKVTTFNGIGAGSAVCPPMTSIIMGYSMVYNKLSNGFLSLRENDFDLQILNCPIGEEKCIVSADPSAEIRIWIVCGENPIPLLMQHTAFERSKPVAASCDAGYSIAYGFGISIPRGLDALASDSYACRPGQSTCYHGSQSKTSSNAVWIACVEESAPELTKITNHVVSVSNPSCTDKNKYSDFKNNLCPPKSRLITGWDMYLSETKKEYKKPFSPCYRSRGGCEIAPHMKAEHDKCQAYYSWISCLAE
ncbi:Membrane attack complex component-perforin (MACPF) domain [Babesia duncani]|uniref:Membrane attack complex component-perforin (MACPF) domain n=1 Tax=Babesia duncani TaxID=323732 RepID=A0AAD9PMI9_9APIC|nr:Membrane attack complex component-perforin (MACPF) domain [Babesia duncani]